MGKPLVIFHGSCADGFCAAWAAWRHFKEAADYLPANYGEPPPDVARRDVYLLDFSYKQDPLRRLVAFNDRVTVLDHHKTAQADLTEPSLAEKCGDKLSVVFDMEKSGGRLAWEHFHSGTTAPWLVDYTEDRDLWRWALPDSKAVSAFVASYPFDFATWDNWRDQIFPGTRQWDSILDAGEAILRYQQQKVDEQVKNAREVEIDGYRVLAVNCTHLTSEIAGKLAEGRPFGAAWFQRADGKRVWSLRSREGGIDVSEVARKRGGGGHRNAAGFEEG